MRIPALLCAAILLTVPALATFAQDWNTGVYAELNGGAVLVGDAKDVASDIVGEGGSVADLPELGKDWQFDLGIGGALGIGYDFGAIRLDGAVSYLSNGISITRAGREVNEATNKDAFTMLAVTGNAWYDIGTGTGWTLYLGGGFGTAKLGIHLVDIEQAPGKPDYDFSTWSLAFQGGAGIGYHVADVMVIDIGYRLLGAIDPELVKSGSVDGQDFKWPLKPGTLLTHRVGLGMRIIFF